MFGRKRRARRAALAKAWFDSMTPEQQLAWHFRQFPHLPSDRPDLMHIQLPPFPRGFTDGR